MTTAPIYEQPKRKYRCPDCGKALLHSEARKHWEQCPGKPKKKLG
jgi:ribosomal protein L37AE/L43A